MDSDKIQQYVLLAKSARGGSLAELITQCTSNPGLFAFGELLAHPGVQELRGGEFAPFLQLLELFCYGTWAEAKAHQGMLPPLSPQQQHKLKQLTTVSLAAKQKVLGYEALQDALDLPDLRQLEDFLITDCFYAGILQGKLDQKRRCLQVHGCISRDVRPEEVPAMAASLTSWLDAAQGLLAGLEAQMAAATRVADAAAQRKSRAEAKQEEVRKNIKAEMEMRQQAGGGGYGEEGDTLDMMDDEAGGGGGMFGAPMPGGRSGATRPKRRR